MKNIFKLFILSLFILTSCSDPFSFNEKGERLPILKEKPGSKGGGFENTDKLFIFDDVDAVTDTVRVVFRTNADSSVAIVAFQGEMNWDEEKLELIEITTEVPTHEHSLFVWNDNMINGVNYTDEGLRISKFAYAGIDPVGVAGAAGLVVFKFRVIGGSTVCVKDFVYNNEDVDEVFCASVREILN